MNVTPKTLVQAKYASNTDHVEYTVPSSTTTIIDKVTATNTDGSAQTISVNLITTGGTAGGSNLITQALSLNSGETKEITDVKNHILGAGDTISFKASVASKMVIRASGRECV